MSPNTDDGVGPANSESPPAANDPSQMPAAAPSADASDRSPAARLIAELFSPLVAEAEERNLAQDGNSPDLPTFAPPASAEPMSNDSSQMTETAPSAREPIRNPAAQLIAELFSPLAREAQDNRAAVQGSDSPDLSLFMASALGSISPQLSDRRIDLGQDHPLANTTASKITNTAAPAGECGDNAATNLIAGLFPPLAGHADQSRGPVESPVESPVPSSVESHVQSDKPPVPLPVAPSLFGSITTQRSTHQIAARKRAPVSRLYVVARTFALALLTLAAGLLLGYGVVGRLPQEAGKPALAEISPVAAASEPAANPAFAPTSAAISPDTASDPDSESLSTSPGSQPSAPVTPPISAATASQSGSAYSDGNSQPPLTPNEKGRAAASVSTSRPLSRPPDPGSASRTQTQVSKVSVQPLRQPRIPPTGSGPAESLLPAARIAAAVAPDALPGLLPGVTDSRVDENVLPGLGLIGAASPGRVDPAYVIHSVQPVYPSKARKQHVEGTVELRVVVGTDGVVRDVEFVSGSPSLAPAAVNAARRFLYSPAFLNGQPIETIQTIDMSFQLNQ